MCGNTHSWLDGPSELGPSPEDCRELQDTRMSGRRHLGLKEVAAAKLAVEELEKRQCREVFWATSYGASAVLTISDRSRLPVRVFHQLDRELFRGVLRGQVCLSSLSNFHPSIHGATCKAGHPYGRVTILLNPSIIISERPEVIVATLIHHMAHAYSVAPGLDEVMVGDPHRKYINRPEATHLEMARHVAARSDFGVGDLADNFKYTQPSGRW